MSGIPAPGEISQCNGAGEIAHRKGTRDGRREYAGTGPQQNRDRVGIAVHDGQIGNVVSVELPYGHGRGGASGQPRSGFPAPG